MSVSLDPNVGSGFGTPISLIHAPRWQMGFGALPARCALFKYQVAKLASSLRSCLRCFTFSL
jgi:hypothetical protein